MISTLPSELQPHNLHVSYFPMMGVDLHANRLANVIPYILMSADLEEALSLRAAAKYRFAVNAKSPVLLPPYSRYRETKVRGKTKRKLIYFPARQVAQHCPATDKEAFWRMINRRPGLIVGLFGSFGSA
jgi:hypothetical protein